MESIVAVGLVVLTVVASVAYVRSESDPAARRRFRNVVLGAVAFAAGGLMLLGLPGGVLMIATLPPVAILHELLGTSPASMADAAWGAAIILTIVWPPCAVVAYTVAFGALKRAPRRTQVAALVGIAYAAGIALTYYGMIAPF